MAWTDTITPDVTQIRKVHIDELRAAIVAKGLFPVGSTWTDDPIQSTSDPNPTIVRAIHFNEIYNLINDKYVSLGLTPTWTSDAWPIQSNETMVRAVHVVDVRVNLDNLPEWKTITVDGCSTIYDIWMTSASHGVLCADEYSSNHQVFFYTEDGGNTWTPATYTPSGSEVLNGSNAIHPIGTMVFSSPSVTSGTPANGYYYFVTSSNSGHSYYKQNDHWEMTSNWGRRQDCWALNTNVIMFAQGTPTNYAAILRSTDGGANYSGCYGLQWVQFYKMWFPSSTNGVAVGNRESGYNTGQYINWVVRTVDGGASWAQVTNIPTLSGTKIQATLSSVHFPSVNIGYCCSLNGHVFKTTDGGIHWSEIHFFNSSFYVNAIYFISDTVGFISVYPYIYKTIDGGATWKKEFEGIGCVEMHSPDGITLFGVGDNNKVYKRTI